MEIDTAFFNGNHAPAVSVEGCYATGQEADQEVVNGNYVGWQEMLPVQKCEPSQRHAWIIPEGRKPITHVRLRMYPDGGIARFRLYGVAVPVWPEIDAKSQEVQLSAAQMGGRAVAVSNQHYGKGFNVLLPGRGKNMGDGWETKRSRTEGHVDWVVVRLGARGKVGGLLIDTMHFRGNFPREIRVHGWDAGDGTEVVFSKEEWEKQDWIEVLGETPMKADTEFSFRGGELKNVEGRLFTHMRLTIIPDGGVKRFRVFGTKA